MKIRKAIITLYASLLLALVSTPVAAQEVYRLSSHGAWNVQVETTSSDSLECVASTFNAQGEEFQIVIAQDSRISFYLLLDETDPNQRSFTVDLDLVIPQVKTWTFRDIYWTGYGGLFQFDDFEQGLRFISDMQRGQTAAFHKPGDSRAYGRLSLRGSNQALHDLVECFTRIVGDPA